jgi:hypothetical protein
MMFIRSGFRTFNAIFLGFLFYWKGARSQVSPFPGLLKKGIYSCPESEFFSILCFCIKNNDFSLIR